MNWNGKELPKIYFYKDGELVWEYVLPEGFKSLEDMRQYQMQCIVKSLGG